MELWDRAAVSRCDALASNAEGEYDDLPYVDVDFLDALLLGVNELTAATGQDAAAPVDDAWWDGCDGCEAVFNEGAGQVNSGSWERESSQLGAGTSIGQLRCIAVTHDSSCKRCGLCAIGIREAR